VSFSRGFVDVTDPGSRWDIDVDLAIGGHPASGVGGLGTLSVRNGGSVSAETNVELWNNATLTLGEGGTLIAKQLLKTRPGSVINYAGGKIDLTDGDAIFDYSGATELAEVAAQIRSGRALGAWNGRGIVSSVAAAHPAHSTTLGAIESSQFIAASGTTTFASQTIDTSAVLVTYTYYGDTDLNGVVNFDDYSRIDNGFNNHLGGWFNGDFDFNGVVNFDDYSLIDLAFNTQSGPPGSNAVPEPVGIYALVTVVATSGAIRRRGHHRRRRRCHGDREN
jgi:T5SS/PEP-CTERM-associated repeat protein